MSVESKIRCRWVSEQEAASWPLDCSWDNGEPMTLTEMVQRSIDRRTRLYDLSLIPKGSTVEVVTIAGTKPAEKE